MLKPRLPVEFWKVVLHRQRQGGRAIVEEVDTVTIRRIESGDYAAGAAGTGQVDGRNAVSASAGAGCASDIKPGLEMLTFVSTRAEELRRSIQSLPQFEGFPHSV